MLRGWSAPIVACRNIIRGCVRWHFWRQQRVRLNVIVARRQWSITVRDGNWVRSNFWDKVRRSRLVEERILAGGRVDRVEDGWTWHWWLNC